MDINSERKTILVVYNDLGVREYVRAVLKYSGYNVLQAPDGAAALVLVQERNQVPLGPETV